MITKKTLVQLTYIINACIKIGYFPTSWKIALVTPIHKAGKKENEPSSYRPISLLPTMGKVLEKVIHKRLTKFERKNIIPQEQFGFREKHSTIQQVARIVNDARIGFNQEMVTTMLLLDIEKAFDRVWIDGLLFKLIKNKYPQTRTKFIAAYLSNRQLKAQINNNTSRKKSIKAGVPQGSVLGPKLFNIYLSDIPTFDKTELALFADDTAIYASSYNAIIASKQDQTHMRILEKYYHRWKINLNATKTEVIVISKKKPKSNKIIQPITVNGHKTEPVKSVKYLGVHLDSGLTYRIDLLESVRKAHAILRKLYPLMVYDSKLSIRNKKLIYKMIIRPIITYAARVWSGAAKSNIQVLQVFQNKMLRLILSVNRYTKITYLHEEAEIEYIGDYCNQLAENFFKMQISSSKLTKNIIRINNNNIPNNYKHRLIHQHLPLFYDVN